MICIEIPLRTIRDQISSLEGMGEEDELKFVAGALAVLEWMLDPTEHQAPIVVLLQNRKGTTH